jgi:hypothetical protein
MRILLGLAFVLGCSSKNPQPAPPPPPHGSDTGSGSDTTQTGGGGPGISEKCGDADACAAGLECVHYRGIAGAAGPEFKTCEKKCTDDKSCPEGRHCATVADGPGRVCR